MSTVLDLVDTIVILMMENRSFDHMLGYLSLKKFGGRTDVNGLRDDQAWLEALANKWQGKPYWPIPLADPRIPDPPHERVNIAMQLGALSGGKYPLGGFIESALGDSDVMNYQTPDKVPMMDFFARNFRICDRWFSCLPAGTQPNRLMAMSGYTLIDHNVHVLPNQTLVYDWLENHDVPWRVYHQGFFPFFSMMPSWLKYTLGPEFKTFDHFAIDVQLEADATFPKVIFIEPIYTDAPHQHPPTDDHSPSSVYGGQELMRQVYVAMAASKRWSRSILIITYDEHGGWFDHEQPIELATTAPQAQYDPFVSSGLRVPGLVVSPLVSAGTCFRESLDHVSILKMLGQKFGQGGGYSPDVDRRAVASVTDILDLAAPRNDLPAPPDPATFPKDSAGAPPMPPPTNENVAAFQKAMDVIKKDFPHELASKFPTQRDFLKV